MSELTKPGVTVSGGDKAVDRSQTTIDNSSRVTKTVDDHSVRSTTVTDNSSRMVNINASDNRRKSHVAIGGGTVASVVAVIAVVLVVIWLVPRGGVAPASRGPEIQQAAPPPVTALSEKFRPTAPPLSPPARYRGRRTRARR